MMAATPSLLTLSKLTVAYGDKQVLQNLSLQIAPGEIVGLVGESGSGKTTLLKTILMLRDSSMQITADAMCFSGRNLRTLGTAALRQLRGPEIGMVFQNAETSLCPVRKIGAQVLELVRSHRSAKKDEIYAKFLSHASALHLKNPDEIWRCYPAALSGGMQQRVSIVMAVMLSPSLLLADEPTASLDTTSQLQVMRTLKLLHAERNLSMLIASHDIGFLSAFTTRIAVLYRGAIVECDTTSRVLSNPKHAYTKALLAAVPRWCVL